MFIYLVSSLLLMFKSLMMFYFSMILLVTKMNLFIEWNMMIMNSINFNMFMYIDWMTLLFLFTVYLISSMIMLYSKEYMSHDNYKLRFFWILLFFIISMMLMILSPSILSILIGWDGLGLTSYCLIMYYQNKSSFNSSMLTIMMNRIGDIFIILSISLMLNYGSFSFLNYNKLNSYIMIFMLIAALTKSAQFPFSSWLPAAMAAPTPVSSLVHSSTLVTAGIYLMIRFNNIMKLNHKMMFIMMILGLITMMMSSLSANFEFDLKKIIAYSTLSQLGLMMMMLSISLTKLVYFHLIIHAMFKSMMFMCSGVMIHSMLNYQDIRYMGLLKNYLPMTLSMFMISNFSLCGLPFYSGFYSKDFLLESMFLLKFNMMMWSFMMFSTMLTVMYSFRLSYYLMNNKFNFNSMYNIHDNKIMTISMFLLMVLSIKFGMIMNWILFNNIEFIFLLNNEKLSIMFICLLGYIIMLMLFNYINLINKMYPVKYFLGKMWFTYKFNYFMLVNILKFGKFYSLIFDKSWSEEFFKLSLFKMNYKFNIMNKLYYNNLINMIMLISFVFMVIMLFF